MKTVLWDDAGDSPAVHETAWTQPALFAVEYAITQLWRSWGVEPAAVIGHSVGEYVAACVAGVFSLPAAVLVHEISEFIVIGSGLRMLRPPTSRARS